ncbi:hypothetical protein HOS58_gp36 [Streptomyces phage Attoomi]|uniref:Uncharacterized protein n=1 Tax=Streptomyces phage Attoomi TaxID=2059881 RepID=A0A2H5BLF4_9CAUD|nr:hypothetical protein HOS58_gp36 [Streptomyces phage Attoomi]AUG87168.1 hypothetical protein SEA_ATTOOMI_36 [Streptomyces phage Attoomi]
MKGIDMAAGERVQVIRLDAEFLEFIVTNPEGEVTATVRMTTARAVELGVITR